MVPMKSARIFPVWSLSLLLAIVVQLNSLDAGASAGAGAGAGAVADAGPGPGTDGSEGSGANVSASTIDNPDERGVIATLSPVALDMAEQLEVMPIIKQLELFESQPKLDAATEIERIRLKQNLTFKISLAQLQVRDVTAKIEHELAYINRLNGVLQEQRDKAIKLNSIENVVASGGISQMGNTLSYMTNQVPNNTFQVIASTATIGLGAWALKKQQGGAHKMEPDPNMLAQVFNIPPDANSTYAPFVWNYLNRPAVNARQTRLAALFDYWRKFDVIPKNLNTPQSRRRIAILTNTALNGRATIDVFNDRSDLLADLRSEVFQCDTDLLELLCGVERFFR
jgi:hypothetical protein